MAEATLIVRLLAKGGAAVKRAVDSAATSLRQFGAAGKAAGAGVREGGERARAAVVSFGKFRTALFDAFLIKALVTGFIRGMTRAAEAVGNLVRAAADASIKLTGTEITLRAATSSTEEYTVANLKAAEIARRYGVDLQVTAKGLADFLAATQTSTLVFSEQVAIFESLVRAGRVLNLSNERIRLSILAIGQIASKGALQMEELKRQLESIPGAVPRLAKALGITVPELFARTSEGAIGASEALRGLRKVFDEISAETAVAAMRTLAAQLGRLEIELGVANIALGDASDDGMRKLAEASTQAAKDLQPLATAIGAFASETLLPFSASLVETAGNLSILVASFLESRDSVIGMDAELKIVRDSLLQFGPAVVLAGGNIDILTFALDRLAEAGRQRRLEEFTQRVKDLQDAAIAGEVELTGAIEKTTAGREKAAKLADFVLKQVLDGNRSIIEGERDLRGIFLERSRAEQLAAEIRKLEDDQHLKDIDAQIKAERKLLQALVDQSDVAKRLAAERQFSVDQIIAGSKVAAEAIIEDSAAAAEATIADSKRIAEEQLRRFREGVEGFEVAAEDREEIELELTAKLLSIQQKFRADEKKLRSDALQDIAEEPDKREEIEKKLSAELIEIITKRNGDIEKLLEDLTKEYEKAAEKREDLAKKASDKEIKEAERSAKKQKQLLESIEDSLDRLKRKRKSALGEDLGGGEVSGPTVGGADTSSLKDLQKELADLDAKFLSTGLSLEENARRLELFINLIPAASAGLQSFGDDLVGVSQKRLADFNTEAKAANDLISSFGDAPGAQQNIRDLIFELEEMAAQGNLTAEELANAFFSLQENIEIARDQTKDSGLPELGEDATVAARGVSKVAEQLEAAGAAVGAVAAESDNAVVKITNLGEEAEAAGGGIQILTDEEGKLTVANQELAESAGEAAKKEQELADAAESAAEKVTIPEEAIESISRLQAVLAELNLEPLLVPLETLASTMRSLSETVPLLPEPLQKVVASLVQLIEKEILAPLAEGFQKLNDQVAPLSEKLPIVAEAQAAFNEAAEKSAGPLGILEEGLKKVTEEELLDRLVKLVESLESINDAAIKISEEGFPKAGEASVDLQEAVADLEVELKDFADFLAGSFSDSLFRLADDFREPLGIIEVVREEVAGLKEDLEVIANETFPAVATAAEGSMDRVSAAVTRAASDVAQLLADLREAVSLSERV